MVDVLLVRPSHILSKDSKENSLFERYIYLARLYLKHKLGFEGTEGLHIPVGLSYIAGVLERNGISVEALDLYLMRFSKHKKPKTIEESTKILRKTLEKKKPRIVGIECMYSRSCEETIKLVEIVKENSNAIVIFGGTHASFFDQFLAKNQSIDYVVRGESELTFLQLSRKIMDNGKAYDVPGTTFKHNGLVIRQPDAERIEELEFLDYPARHLFDMELLYKLNNSTDFIISSRGCKSNCTFCINKAFWKQQFIERDIDSVIGEMEYMIKKFHTKHFCFYDETFGFRKDVKEISNTIKKKMPDIDWAIESRLDTFNSKNFKSLSDSNCNLIYFGFEAFSDSVLSKCNKNITVQKSLENLKSAKTNGIKSIMGTFIVGLPGETVDSFKKTLSIVEKLVKNKTIDICYFLPLMPFPGTAIYNNPEKFGIKIHTKNFNQYYYILDNPVTLETETMSSEDIKKMHTIALERMIDITKDRMKEEGIYF